VVEHAVKIENEFKTETEEFLVTRKIEIAEKKKEEGNALFKAGEYAKTSQRYEKGAKFIESVSDEEKSQSKALKTSCNLNNAAYKLKLKDYEQAKKLCTKVLDIDSRNVKALYRRAQAYLHLFNLEKAEIDIRKALEIEPDNREVKLEYKALKDKAKEYNKKDAKLYSNMFSKLTKLESNEIPAGKTEVKEDAKAKEATAIAELSSEEEQLEQLEAEKAEEVSEEKEAEKAKKQTVSDKLEDEGIKGNEDTVPMKDQEKAVEVVTAEYEHIQSTGVQKNDAAEEHFSLEVTDDVGIKADDVTEEDSTSIDHDILKAVEEIDDKNVEEEVESAQIEAPRENDCLVAGEVDADQEKNLKAGEIKPKPNEAEVVKITAQMKVLEDQVSSAKAVEKEVKQGKTMLTDDGIQEISLEAKPVERDGKGDQVDQQKERLQKEKELKYQQG
ncbi:hypothetical protein Drorol1_Dr00019590, partial [Drosera rotundifolia]